MNFFTFLKKTKWFVYNHTIGLFTYDKKLERYMKRLTKRIIHYYQNNNEYAESVSVLKEKGFQTFPFRWIDEYSFVAVKVEYDKDNFPYVIHKGKKLFFPKTWNTERIQQGYTYLCIEQDPRSPHAYFSDTFKIDPDSVFLDIGSAEGLISLENIDQISKAFLFECDSEWIEALNRTFNPYKSKVIIINKFVGKDDTNNHISMDTFLKTNNLIQTNNLIFMKVDIEGAEEDFLLGMSKSIRIIPNLKLALCAYHRPDAKSKFTSMLEPFYSITYSDSYMLWPWYKPNLKIKPPYFVTGMIRAEKKHINI